MSASPSPTPHESVAQRLSWRHLAFRLLGELVVYGLLVGGIFAGRALGLNASLAAWIITAYVLVAQGAVLYLLWPRWQMLVEVSTDEEPTKVDKFWQKRIVPGSVAAWKVWAVVIALVGTSGLLLDLLKSDSRVARIVVGLLLGIGLLGCLLLLWNRDTRQQFFGARTPWNDAFQMAGIIAIMAAAAFSFLTNELHQADLVELTRDGKDVTTVEPAELFWFYGWHLIDALPASPLSTLKIDPPYEYKDTSVGALLLAYALLVVTPFLSLAKTLIARRRRTGPDGNQEHVATLNDTDGAND
ncbi:hypothetical protein ACIBL3_46530 [Kribbella sp. NPDC050124]|uniref:hypothetical protein n=1 Tax=Kribbella sp. NPDC050124 TaxID=3364114 RepID=UPI0037A5C78F